MDEKAMFYAYISESDIYEGLNKIGIEDIQIEIVDSTVEHLFSKYYFEVKTKRLNQIITIKPKQLYALIKLSNHVYKPVYSHVNDTAYNTQRFGIENVSYKEKLINYLSKSKRIADNPFLLNYYRNR